MCNPDIGAFSAIQENSIEGIFFYVQLRYNAIFDNLY